MEGEGGRGEGMREGKWGGGHKGTGRSSWVKNSE